MARDERYVKILDAVFEKLHGLREAPDGYLHPFTREFVQGIVHDTVLAANDALKQWDAENEVAAICGAKGTKGMVCIREKHGDEIRHRYGPPPAPVVRSTDRPVLVSKTVKQDTWVDAKTDKGKLVRIKQGDYIRVKGIREPVMFQWYKWDIDEGWESIEFIAPRGGIRMMPQDRFVSKAKAPGER